SPHTNDILTATATRSDADGDAVSLHYVWKNGTTEIRRASWTASTWADLTDAPVEGDSGNGSKGDTITVDVTPNDGSVNGTMVRDTATLQNSGPVATLGLDHSSPHTNDILTATATRSDADGDAVSLHYVWKNGTT